MPQTKINPVGAGIAGAAVGLSVGVAAATLSNKKTRQKAFKTVARIKDQAFDVAQNLSNRVSEMSDYLDHEPVENAVKRVGRAYGSSKKTARKRK